MAEITLTDSVARALALAADRGGWHPTLSQALDGVTHAQARWRPGPGRNCIWDVVRHVRHWKRATLESWERGWSREDFAAYEARDWGGLPEPDDAAAWRRDVAELLAVTEELGERVRGLEPAALAAVPANARVPRAWNLLNLATHDAYHAGQIMLLRRLQERA